MIELIIIAVLVFLLIATNVIWFVSWEKSDTRWFIENLKLNDRWADELTKINHDWYEICEKIRIDYNKLFESAQALQKYYAELIEEERESNAE